MTLLEPAVPTLSIEDNFRLTYHGTYGQVVYDKDTASNHVEQKKGVLPHGRFVWDGVDHLGGLEPGASALVPFDLIRVFFGDPRSISKQRQRFEDRKGRVGDIAPREEETRRLSVLYGLYDIAAGRLDEVVPDVTITTAEDEEVVCVATDPLGHHVYGHIGESAENYDLATTIEKMKMQIRLLEDQAKAETKKGAKNDGADVSIDGPPSKS